ncbi:hypothetical protein FOPG_19145 [Fusarium oxysporum f. sp. conglutinans race 2 54008]|uniref:Cyclin-like domain-containing protein n=2 Tax=Fusarium oxysporum f. sp. conglutinans TaxID=100902 RepID=F9F6F4_FUSOF|nr:hypothetical protein FOXB_01979 [Fusarium oxysporum f. sp. conglutinans Fo5176]EXL64599.1 hypothetical protein FOPG_19145 [Fusarium oxysporum f. sp. conglutinans race 2 54008]KAG7000077.1 G1/S-specific cyclin CCN1 [Fusarium oxysporum f. sp. conglutinans]
MRSFLDSGEDFKRSYFGLSTTTTDFGHNGFNSQCPLLGAPEQLEDLRVRLEEMKEQEQPDASVIDRRQDHLWETRPKLIHLLIDAHASFNLLPRTLFLAVNILDRYCSKQTVYKNKYNLAGFSALLIASKLIDEPDKAPHIRDLLVFCQDNDDHLSFIAMERHILTRLEWTISHATIDVFVDLMTTMEGHDEEVRHMATYLSFLCLSYRASFETTPFDMARSCISVAVFILKQAVGNLIPSDPLESWILSTFCNLSGSTYEAAWCKNDRFAEVARKLEAFRDQPRHSLRRVQED